MSIDRRPQPGAPDAQRDEILARLAQSRADIRRVLEPPPVEPGETLAAPGAAAGEFPRSRTMRMLMSGRGLGVAGAVLAGLLIARPKLAWRLIRLLPTGALARMLMLRAIAAMRAKP
jgi:hypothetical protein